MEVKIKKLHPEAIIPKYASDGAACFDLHAVFEPTVDGTYLHELTNTPIDTGLAFEIPEDHVMLVFSRSGHGFKNDVRLANCVGVIDSDYRGEVKVKLTADNGSIGLHVGRGDRIAQAMILPVKKVGFIEVDELGSTERGAGGFGSTGTGVVKTEEEVVPYDDAELDAMLAEDPYVPAKDVNEAVARFRAEIADELEVRDDDDAEQRDSISAVKALLAMWDMHTNGDWLPNTGEAPPYLYVDAIIEGSYCNEQVSRWSTNSLNWGLGVDAPVVKWRPARRSGV